MNAIINLTEGIPFFSGFSNEEIELMLANGNSFVRYKDGEVIIEQGDFENSAVFIILSGSASVRKEEYHEHIIDYIETGSIVGESAFLVNGRSRMASVIADGVVETFKLDRSIIEQFDCPLQLKITKKLVETIVDRLDKMHGAMAALIG
ncbi:MAG: cyclic nucleotide-binding domain-containing protein [Magnetococcales bacterium]|nr:cyclic nucleotide-binding domain-containing protein [Magnetococcales bacterium]